MINLGPFHILSYGTLLGAQVFQTFIGGSVAFRTLERPQFATLQKGLFPIYFSLQTFLPAVTALTFPSTRIGSSGLRDLLAEENRFVALVPLSITLLSGLTNIIYFSPLVSETMDQRYRQETIDGKKSYDPAPQSKEMVALNKRFARLHGYSSLVNMIALLATISYGFFLGSRLS
jgi:hypothetical protein